MKKATIELIDGRMINLELYEDIAPISVENFIDLAKSGFYDGLCFHRIIDGFMIQGGGFSYCNGLKEKRAEKTIKGEFASNGVPNSVPHKLGVLSMARTTVKNSATSQFFICVADANFLDGEYAAFGKTADTESEEIVKSIGKVKTSSSGMYQDVPVEPIVIKSITV